MGRKSRRGGQRAAAAKKKVGRIKKKVRTVAPKKKAPEPKAPPRGDFNSQFEEAFNKLDRESGKRNFLLISDLRKELPQFSAEEFNSGALQLMRDRRFGAEGLSSSILDVPLTAQQKAGAIKDGRETLYFIRRRG